MTATAAPTAWTCASTVPARGSTFDAHRLLHLAAESGLQDALKERLLRATFTDG
jgi:predicted DsbA family dithiol-disulfide isomerase